MKLHKYNLQEHRQLFALLKEGPVLNSMAAKYPGWKPKEKWTGPYAKYEPVLIQFQAKPVPKPYGEEAAYEMLVGNDYVYFFDSGLAYGSNIGMNMGYGMLPDYPKPSIVLFTDQGKTKKTDKIEGYITLEGGKPKWNDVENPESKEESNPYLDTFQLILDFVGVIPGFGDIADIINAAISFGRGNYLDGFLSLIGAIPVVGSALMLPVKLTLKAFSKAGDVIKTAWKTGKSADEVWLFLKEGGKLDKAQLDALAKGMGDAADYVTSFRKAGDAVLPDAAVKGLDDLAGFLKKNADKADEIFSGAAEIKKTSKFKDVGSILKAKKDLNTITGFKRLIGGRILRRLTNLFSTALSPTELQALRGAMNMKFFRNMDNPGKLTTLLTTIPNNQKLVGELTAGLGTHLNSLAKNKSAYKSFLKKYNNAMRGLTGAKATEARLKILKDEAPELYQSAYKKIVATAQEQKNPLYRDFMENEINGLGSYFSKDYANLISWDGVKSRLSNLVPVIWNELQDVGEDIKMEMGLETQDDVNGLFWPLVKSTIGAAENIGGGVGDFIKGAEQDVVRKTIQTVPNIPIIGNIATGIAGPEAGAKYDPNVDFEIVPEKDPKLQQQKKEKKKAIEKRRSWF
jgi:hypothetical protein